MKTHPAALLTACLLLAAPASTPAAEPNAFLNLSSRARVDRGENIIVGGLVLDRTANVLVRGVGPSLAGHGVAEPVPMPRLSLFNAVGQLQATNADWRAAIPAWTAGDGSTQPYAEEEGPAAAVERVMAGVGAFPLGSIHDTALYMELPRGIYTVHMTADDTVSGVGLVEIYLVPDEVDPFAPAWRVRQDPSTGYAPSREGLAPLAVVDESSGRTLHLEFDAPMVWSLPSGGTLSRSVLELTWASSGTPDLRHGRPGVTDSRDWLTAPRYTKTGPDAASAACISTIDTLGSVVREEISLDFDSPGAGTFTYRWGTDDTANDRIGTVGGQGQGVFQWVRSATAGGGTPARRGGRFFRNWPASWADGRPAARWSVAIEDLGPVMHHGDGPDDCDIDGMREAIVTDLGAGNYLMHYDGLGRVGFRACQATSTDLLHWQKHGPVLDLGPAGSDDAGAACSPWIIQEGGTWHMFYFAAPNRDSGPGLIPTFPYLTRKAHATSALGPWTKQPSVVPFDPAPGTFYSTVAAPGHVLYHGGEYLQFFSSTTTSAGAARRTLGLARTHDLDSAWTIDPQPLFPIGEQIENSSLYFEASQGLWFLFTNHIAKDALGREYTDAVWMYWSDDLTRWDSNHRAVVLDASSSSWLKGAVGMPTVLPVGGRLAVFYDGPAGSDLGHLDRDIGLAMLDLPLRPPAQP